MGTSGFAKTAEQHFVAGVKKENLQVVPRRTDLGEYVRPILKELTGTKINAKGDFLDFFAIALAKINKFGDQNYGEIIDTEKTVIL